MFSFIRTFLPCGGMKARIFWSNILLFLLSEIFISVMLRNVCLLHAQNMKMLSNETILWLIRERKCFMTWKLWKRKFCGKSSAFKIIFETCCWASRQTQRNYQLDERTIEEMAEEQSLGSHGSCYYLFIINFNLRISWVSTVFASPLPLPLQILPCLPLSCKFMTSSQFIWLINKCYD